MQAAFGSQIKIHIQENTRMVKRIGIVVAFGFLLALGLAVHATPASAQTPTYFTYVSEWQVPRAQWAAFETERAKMDSGLQSLVADGTIIAWGNDDITVHTEDGYTQEDWFTAASRANILKALDMLRPMSTGGAFTTVTKHRDFFMRTLVHNGKTSTGATGYLRVAEWQAKPHQGEALAASVKRYLIPLLDSEVADGTVLMYNFDEEDLHTDPIGAYFLAVLYPSGAAYDKARAELSAMEKANPASEEEIDNLTIDEAHRDGLAKVTSYQHK
jgi:hypothetical protein